MSSKRSINWILHAFDDILGSAKGEMSMPELICPVCREKLILDKRSYRCGKGHCFDLAKSGYVNLLPPSAGGKRHGDDKLMVKARSRFLDKGFYDKLSDAVAQCVNFYSPDLAHIVDAGCGEGKYTADMLKTLEQAGKQAHILGIDISKDALICAAKRCKNINFCAASTAHMPIEDESCHIVVNIFSPFMAEEFYRVLKPGAKLIRVVPLKMHLWELKALIYDKPFPNPPMDMEAPGFKIVDTQPLCYEISLNSSEEIMDLFMMTPYYYKTGAADQQKAAQAEHLETKLEFGIYVYEKL